MAKKTLIFLLLTFNASGSSLFMPDSDTAILLELVITTVSQLNELEKLVSNAEKLTGKIQQYNEVVISQWYRAQRIAFIVDDLSTIHSTRITNLGELNRAIRDLKDNIKTLEDMMMEYDMVRVSSNKMSKAADRDDLTIMREKNLAELQIEYAHSAKNVGNLQKINTQINSYSNKHLVDLKNKSNQQIKLMSIRNEVEAMEKEKSLQKEMKIKKFYDLE